MPYMEIASLVGGAVSGFVFKMMAQAAADRMEQFKMLVELNKQKEEAHNAAVQRVPNDKAGNWIRRVIVLSILFGVILAPFLLALLHEPVVVEVQTPVKTFLGMFSYGGKTIFYEMKGYLLIPEIRQALLAIIGFYFGTASAKR